MKKIVYLTLTLLFGIHFSAKAQNVSQTKTELNKVLCKTWQVDYAIMNGSRINQLPNNIAFELVFNPDNSYFVINAKDKKKGKWTFNEKGKYIDLSINNKTTSRITKINDNELIFVLVPDGKSNPPGLSDMEIYCKTK